MDCVFGKQIDLRAILRDSDGGQGSEEDIAWVKMKRKGADM